MCSFVQINRAGAFLMALMHFLESKIPFDQQNELQILITFKSLDKLKFKL